VVAFLEARARTALGVLEAHLTGRDWIVGDTMTLADLSCAGYMFYEDEFPFDWASEFPAITAWKDRIRALPGWKPPYDLMPGKN
jgi:glutathione S-transferase